MAMILTYPTWQDQSLSSHHNFPVKSFLRSSIGLPTVKITEDVSTQVVTIKIEVVHEGEHFEVSENHFYVNADRDKFYFHRVMRRLADRLLNIVLMDQMDRWLDLTP